MQEVLKKVFLMSVTDIKRVELDSLFVVFCAIQRHRYRHNNKASLYYEKIRYRLAHGIKYEVNIININRSIYRSGKCQDPIYSRSNQEVYIYCKG